MRLSDLSEVTLLLGVKVMLSKWKVEVEVEVEDIFVTDRPIDRSTDRLMIQYPKK